MKKKWKITRCIAGMLIAAISVCNGSPGMEYYVHARVGFHESFYMNEVKWEGFTEYDSSQIGVVPIDIPDNSTLVFPTKEQVEEQVKAYEKIEEGDSVLKSYLDQGPFYFAINSMNSEIIDKVASIEIPEDYGVFPCPEQFVWEKQRYLTFNGNKSISRITVNTTKGNNGFDLCEATFHNLEELTNVYINVGPNQTIKLDGSTFARCKKLTSVTLIGSNVTLEGSYNFAGCKKLKNIYVQGNLTIDGNQDFAGCTSLENIEVTGNLNIKGANPFPKSSKFGTNSKITIGGNVVAQSEERNVADQRGIVDNQIKADSDSGIVQNTNGIFDECQGTIDTISIKGTGSDLGSNFLNGVTVNNFNIEGKDTTFADSSVVDSTIQGVSFNASCEFGNNNGAFVNDKISNMYFNNAEMTGTIAGGNTSVANTYFNNTDVFQNKIKGMEQIKDFSFGNATYKAIYFLNPDTKAISNVPNPAKGKETTVYAYGGTISKYGNDATLLTSEDMFRKWVGDNYQNMVTIDEENSIMGRDGKVDVNLYLLNGETEITYPLNNMNIFATYNKTAIDMDHELAAKNLAQGKLKLTYTTNKDASTNFNYKVLEKIDSSKVTGKDQYVYKDGNDCYVACQKNALTLTASEETYQYFIQAAGKIYPLNIRVEKNELKSIEVKTVSGGALQVTKGAMIDSDEHKNQLIVTGVMKNNERISMEPSQYVIFKSKGETVAENDDSYYIECAGKSTSIKVQVYDGKVTSFQAECKKNQMAEGEELTLEDVRINNIGFDNPATPLSNEVKGEVKFLQDGVEKDTYTIKKGTNEIALVYAGHTEEKACTVTGIDNTVKSFRVIDPSREIELYKKTTLNVNEVNLTDVVFEDSRLDKISLVKKGFTFLVDGEKMDTVELKEGKNIIGVSYNGCEIQDALVVNALPTTVESIEANYVGPAVYEGGEVSTDTSVLFVTVHYAHPTTASVLVTNIDITLGTYEIVPGQDNNIYVYYKGVRSQKPIKVLGLANPVVALQKITYSGDKTAGAKIDQNKFYVEVAYASGKIENSVENPDILKQLSFSGTKFTAANDVIQVHYKDTVSANYSVSKNGIVLESSVEQTMTPTAEVTKQPVSTATEKPVTVVTPEPTKVAEDASQTTHTTGTSIATVMPTATAVVPAAPATTVQPVSSVKEGDVRTVEGLNYKIKTMNGSSGTVSVVGYDKSADKIKIVSAITVDGMVFQVTKIEKNAFKNCTKLTGSILLNKNITSIGDSAFYGCKNITKVVFGSNVNQIGSKSFYGCKKLKTIQFMSDGVKKIGSKAFKGIAKKYSIKAASKYKAKYKKLVKKAK